MTDEETIKTGSITDLREILLNDKFLNLEYGKSFSLLIDRVERLELENVSLRCKTEVKKKEDIPEKISRLERALAYTTDALYHHIKLKCDDTALFRIQRARDILLKD